MFIILHTSVLILLTISARSRSKCLSICILKTLCVYCGQYQSLVIQTNRNMCAIFGVFNRRKAAELTAVGLHGNQHRAIDYAGIVSSDGFNFYRERGKGLARQVFTENVLDRLHGKDALGHIRYPTVTDDNARDNIQPIVGSYGGKPIAIAHNGNLTNLNALRKILPDSRMSTSMDTEFILRLLEMRNTGEIEADLKFVFSLLQGSFSLGILLPDRLIAVCDKSGNRPLSVGRLKEGYCISSETCAFGHVAAKHLSDVEPGTMVSISIDGLSVKYFGDVNGERRQCRFEGPYFSHPGSIVFGEDIARFRIALGQALEERCPVEGGADIVTPIPDSANFIAMGYGKSRCSGEFFPVISRSHYVGRTFIAANQALRDMEVAQKFTFNAGEIRGKRVVVVDDSIVRGTTMPKIVRVLRELDALEVHVRIGTPPIRFPCRYGINTPTQEELISNRLLSEEICRQISADSLEFIPLEAFKALSPHPEKFCYVCWDGNYW